MSILGLRSTPPPTQAFVSAMADTGCQSCLAGYKVVKQLGLSTKDLIPVDLRMHAADNHDIQLLGVTILRLSGKDHSGKERSTRQVVYVTNHTDKLFLSREACTDLGIISHQFPLLGETEECQSSPLQSTHALRKSPMTTRPRNAPAQKGLSHHPFHQPYPTQPQRQN